MRQTRRTIALQTHCLAFTAALMLFAGAAEAKDALPDPRGKAAQASSSRVVRSKAVRPQQNPSPTTRLQTAVLRYTSLPRNARSEFHPEDRTASSDATDTPEARCARSAPLGTPSSSNDKVSPCLGLYHGGEPASTVKFRFDLALKSIGAPKDIFVGQCTAGSNSPTCNNTLSEAHAEQERLADTLNRQRRYPVATLGVAVSF